MRTLGKLRLKKTEVLRLYTEYKCSKEYTSNLFSSPSCAGYLSKYNRDLDNILNSKYLWLTVTLQCRDNFSNPTWKIGSITLLSDDSLFGSYLTSKYFGVYIPTRDVKKVRKLLK